MGLFCGPRETGGVVSVISKLSAVALEVLLVSWERSTAGEDAIGKDLTPYLRVTWYWDLERIFGKSSKDTAIPDLLCNDEVSRVRVSGLRRGIQVGLEEICRTSCAVGSVVGVAEARVVVVEVVVGALDCLGLAGFC